MLYGQRSILTDEHWPPPDTVRRPNDPLTFHLFDQPGGSVVPNP